MSAPALFGGRRFTSSIINLYKKLTEFDKKLGVINNGVDNLYPERIDRFINNSVTAKTCAKLMSNYLVGDGFGAYNEVSLGKGCGDLLQTARQIANSITRQYGVYLLFKVDGNFDHVGAKVMPYANMRNGRRDDEKYIGKYAYHSDWSKQGLKNSDLTWFHAFTTNKDIIQQQVENTKGNNLREKLQNYRGQIMYINLTDDYEYSLSMIDSVMQDCDSEAQAQQYKNKSLRRGFFGKTMVVTRPLAGELQDYENEVAYNLAQNERDAFKENLQSLIGAENTGDMLHFEYDLLDGESIDDLIKFINIDSNVNDKVFEYTEQSVFKNILMAFNSVPPALVRPENSVFSASGDSIEAMRQVYFDNTKYEREMLQMIMNKITNIVLEEKYDLIPIINGVTNN